jgi:hypothetical protein
MSIPREPAPAKLVIGLFMGDTSLFEKAAHELVRSFGEMDMVSSWLPFDDTDYYAKEMGSPLFRRFTVFSRLITQNQLVQVKLRTNELESAYGHNGRRTINIDPGIMTAERFVLASGKNFTHRVYLKNGIYADLTLIYHHGDFRTLPWTYPDYAGDRIRRFLRIVRDRYMKQLKT